MLKMLPKIISHLVSYSNCLFIKKTSETNKKDVLLNLLQTKIRNDNEIPMMAPEY